MYADLKTIVGEKTIMICVSFIARLTAVKRLICYG